MIAAEPSNDRNAGPSGALVRPDFSVPLDTAERLQAAPEDGLVKGWILQSVLSRAKKRGLSIGRRSGYLPFKSYPLHEHLELLAEASETFEPGVPPRETLRRIGRQAYPAFRDSRFGKVVLASFGSSSTGERGRHGLQWLAKGYPLTSKHTRASVQVAADRALIRLVNVWTFPDCYHLGIFEGAAVAFDRRLDFRVHAESLSETWIEITWIRASNPAEPNG